MPQPPDNVASQLRAAVLASDHEQATRLTVEYTGALGRYWTLLSPPERAVSSMPKDSLELLTWVREMTLMQQAMAAKQLAMVEKAGRTLVARSVYLQLAALGEQR